MVWKSETGADFFLRQRQLCQVISQSETIPGFDLHLNWYFHDKHNLIISEDWESAHVAGVMTMNKVDYVLLWRRN